MFTTHTTKYEFYDWWQKQDHKKHTCGDMVIHALLRAHWSNPLEPDYTRSLKLSFVPDKKFGYQKVIRVLKAYGTKWVFDYSTFAKVLPDHEFRKAILHRLQPVIQSLEENHLQVSSNGA